LRAALDASGAAIVPVPVVGMTVSQQYVQRLLDATRPDDPDAPLEDDDIAVVVATSGSTGHPRGVLHTADTLQALSNAVNGSSAPQWIAALPLTSMGGLNVLLRAVHCGVEPVAMASIGGAVPFTPGLFCAAVDEARRRGPDVRVALVAAQVRRLLADDAGSAALASCDQVLVGAGPVPATTLLAAQRAGIALIRTYGATETAGGCVYDGMPLPGVRVAFDPGRGTEASRLPTAGEIVLNGPMIARGYRLDPGLTGDRFTSGGYRTGDLGHLAEGRLVVTGRMDDVVIVNGVNVSVSAIEAVIEDLAPIAACAVLSLPGDGGDAAEPILCAAVVPREPFLDLAEVVRDAVRQALGAPAVPRRIAVLDELPMLPNGKIDRRTLAARATSPEGPPWQQ
jgi:O-succinylbenzoic acid--CoA ligase